eukprot:7042914-Heterocapsa_arctica.AAC.1
MFKHDLVKLGEILTINTEVGNGRLGSTEAASQPTGQQADITPFRDPLMPFSDPLTPFSQLASF